MWGGEASLFPVSLRIVNETPVIRETDFFRTGSGKSTSWKGSVLLYYLPIFAYGISVSCFKTPMLVLALNLDAFILCVVVTVFSSIFFLSGSQLASLRAKPCALTFLRFFSSFLFCCIC